MGTNQKQELFNFCQVFINERIERIHHNIDDIQASLTTETKSSAGDKHETGRAMLQLEREKLGHQLAEAEKMRHTLLKVPLSPKADHIGLGSLVKTTTAQYFMSVSVGEYKKGDTAIYCVSVATPIGQLLLGKSVGETITFNGKSINILAIS